MKKLKYVKTFDSFQVNELFSLFKRKEDSEEIKNLKKEIEKVFPESIYGNYLDKLRSKELYKLHEIIEWNKTDFVCDTSVIIDSINGNISNDEKKKLLKRDKTRIEWLIRLFKIIEQGSFLDFETDKEYTFDFLDGKKEISYKQIINNFKSKSDLISELIKISKKDRKDVFRILESEFRILLFRGFGGFDFFL